MTPRWLVVVAVAATIAACGGKGTPSPSPTPAPAPTPPPPSGPAPAIASITPSTSVASVSTYTFNFAGTNFSPGLSVILTPPGGSATTYPDPSPQIQEVTATSFRMRLVFNTAGVHTFQIRNRDGLTSNIVNFPVRAPWDDEGDRLRPTDFTPNNGQIADDSVVRLQDGRWRMYVQVSGTGTRTAVSADGLNFTAEATPVIVPGQRTPDGMDLFPTHPRAVALEDGRIRLFVVGRPEALHSAICAPAGVPCALEAGERLSVRGVANSMTGVGIVRLRDGRWRAYFTANVGESERGYILSATSTDMLTWSIEPGVRIGPGAPVLTRNAHHPSAVLNTDGSVTVFFKRVGRETDFVYDGIWYSNSADGLSFTSEVPVLPGGSDANGFSSHGDPDAVRLADGRVRLYTSWTFAPAGQMVNQWRVKSAIGRIEGASLDQMLDASSPVSIPQGHSLRERIGRAERGLRGAGDDAIADERAVEAINAMADSLRAPGWARTNIEQFQAVRGRAGDLSPIDAVVTTLSLASRKMRDPDYQIDPADWVVRHRMRLAEPYQPLDFAKSFFSSVGAAARDVLLIEPMRRSIEDALLDEHSDASLRAHQFLDWLGIPR